MKERQLRDNSPHRSLRVLQVNARSMRDKTHEIAEVLHREGAHICAVSETWLQGEDDMRAADEEPPEIEGYRWQGVARKGKRGGGVGFYVAEDVEFRPARVESQDKAVEIDAISVHVRGAPRVHVASVYIPPTVKVKLDALKKLPLARTLILGDLNGHNRTWSLGTENKRGTQLYRFIRSNSMSAFGFRDTPTHNSDDGSPSSPDLIIAGRDVAPTVREWRLSDDIGSDHIPTFCELHIPQRARQREREYKWKHKTLDTERYQQSLTEGFAKWKQKHPLERFEPSKAYTGFVDTILNA